MRRRTNRGSISAAPTSPHSARIRPASCSTGSCPTGRCSWSASTCTAAASTRKRFEAAGIHADTPDPTGGVRARRVRRAEWRRARSGVLPRVPAHSATESGRLPEVARESARDGARLRSHWLVRRARRGGRTQGVCRRAARGHAEGVHERRPLCEPAPRSVRADRALRQMASRIRMRQPAPAYGEDLRRRRARIENRRAARAVRRHRRLRPRVEPGRAERDLPARGYGRLRPALPHARRPRGAHDARRARIRPDPQRHARPARAARAPAARRSGRHEPLQPARRDRQRADAVDGRARGTAAALSRPARRRAHRAQLSVPQPAQCGCDARGRLRLVGQHDGPDADHPDGRHALADRPARQPAVESARTPRPAHDARGLYGEHRVCAALRRLYRFARSWQGRELRDPRPQSVRAPGRDVRANPCDRDVLPRRSRYAAPGWAG